MLVKLSSSFCYLWESVFRILNFSTQEFQIFVTFLHVQNMQENPSPHPHTNTVGCTVTWSLMHSSTSCLPLDLTPGSTCAYVQSSILAGGFEGSICQTSYPLVSLPLSPRTTRSGFSSSARALVGTGVLILILALAATENITTMGQSW